MIDNKTGFTKRYGKQTVQIVSDLLRGRSIAQISAKRGLALGTVRTTAGNFTRGFYNSFVS